MNKNIAIFCLILPAMTPVFAQLKATTYIDALLGAAVTGETGRDVLPHASFGAAIGIFTDGPWGFLAQTGGVYQTPTTFSDYWYRYRGYFGLNSAIGVRHQLGPLDIYACAGGMLAHYDLSYSWFWFPYLQAGIDIPVVKFNDRVKLALGLSIPVYFRADAYTAGIIVTTRLMLMQQPHNNTVEGAVRP